MTDIKKCKTELRQMYEWKNPDKYSKNKKYKTENERYNSIYEKIMRCSNQERDNLEIKLKCEKGSSERLLNFMAIVPLFISFISLVVSASNTLIPNTDDMTVFMFIYISSLALIAIIMYILTHNLCSRNIDRITYLLGVLENVNKYKK